MCPFRSFCVFQHFDEVDDIQSASGNLSFISSLTQNTVPGSKGTSLHSGRNVLDEFIFSD